MQRGLLCDCIVMQTVPSYRDIRLTYQTGEKIFLIFFLHEHQDVSHQQNLHVCENEQCY